MNIVSNPIRIFLIGDFALIKQFLQGSGILEQGIPREGKKMKTLIKKKGGRHEKKYDIPHGESIADN
jgi:hypothetical protein